MNKHTHKKIAALSLVAGICSACGPDTSTQKEETPTEETVKTTKETIRMIENESGLKHIVLSPAGTDAKNPNTGDRVMVHYTGWLYDEDATDNDNKGQKFDSSVDRGKPFEFTVGIGQVIKGWDEGLVAMKVGESRRLVIPAELAYGSRSVGNVIPPDATLIFDVELLEVS